MHITQFRFLLCRTGCSDAVLAPQHHCRYMASAAQWTLPACANNPQCSYSHINCKTCPEPAAEPRALTPARLCCCARAALSSERASAEPPQAGDEQMFILRKQCPHAPAVLVAAEHSCTMHLLQVLAPLSHSSKLGHLYFYIPRTPFATRVL